MRFSAAILASAVSASGAPVRPCDVAPGKGQPWCDATRPMEERLKDLVARIPDADVPGVLSSADYLGGVPSIGLEPYQFWNEGLHGVGYSDGVDFENEKLSATSFPQVVTTSMSFNTTLFHAIGEAISTEARAFNNIGRAGLTYWAPNINIFRDPRWGRGQETPGEDPFLTAQYATNFVRGMQQGEDRAHLKASACLKHFTAYDLEGWEGVDRHHFDAIVSQQDLEETFNVPFEAGVRHGGASAIMCSYNSVNGVPSCANKELLTDLARKEWGFDGYITSDCWAVVDVIDNHNYTKTPDETNLAVLKAGMDTDCGSFFNQTLSGSMADGAVSRDLIDTALTNIFRVRMRLGQFDPADEKNPYTSYGMDRVDTPEHQQLALEAARQGIVLLKNDGVLPFDSSLIKTLAVVGPAANRTDILQGNYFGHAAVIVSVADGLRSYVDVRNASGCWAPPEVVNGYHPTEVPSVGCDVSHFEDATSLAATADATVVVLGLDQGQETESRDRTHLGLPGLQQQLAEAVAAASKGPVVLLVLAGGALDLTFARDSEAFSAILFAGYPGQAGGVAIAETLFGENNPSGRLTQTFYPASFIEAWKNPSVGYFDMNMRPSRDSGNPGRGYRFYTGEPVYAFGSGLSYTKFEYSELTLGRLASTWAVEIQVTNVGRKDGRHTILGYIAAPTQVGHSHSKLVAFENVFLNAGASEKVKLTISRDALAVVDADGKVSYPTGDWLLTVRDKSAKLSVVSEWSSAVLV